jgi:glycosyltransferase involved in cell wall biosynthesis
LIEALGIHYTGGGRSATLNLLEPLFKLDTETEYTVLLSQPEPTLENGRNNVRQVVAPTKHRLGLRLWAQAVIPLLVRDYDLVHFVKNLTVLGVSAKTAVTVYDLTILLYPHLFPRLDVWYWRWIQPMMLRQADRVIAISHTTAQDLQRFYHLPPAAINTIYPACNSRFKPATEEEIQRVTKKYHLPDQTVIHVGRIDRKKNLPSLLHAFSMFQRQSSFGGKLVLVGEEYPKSVDTTLERTMKQLQIADDVIFTGPVPSEDLPGLYSSAMMVVFPSLHEGFGLVALEAMACGTPLVVTDAGAIREVVRDAAVIVDSPRDVEALSHAMIRLWEDPGLREELRVRGLQVAERFSQEEAARQMLGLYREVIGAK